MREKGNRFRRGVTGLPHDRQHGRKAMTGLREHHLRRSRRATTGLPDSRGKRVTTGLTGARVIRYGHSYRKDRRADVRKRHVRTRHGIRIYSAGFAAFALPDQTLYPPYYRAERPWRERPEMRSSLQGGATVEQGSRYRSHIQPGLTAEQGNPYASHIEGGRTVEQGSRYRSHIAGGKTVEKGSQWSSTMRNWTFSGTQSPMRPGGLTYYQSW